VEKQGNTAFFVVSLGSVFVMIWLPVRSTEAIDFFGFFDGWGTRIRT
jgi:hypothetical protein